MYGTDRATSTHSYDGPMSAAQPPNGPTGYTTTLPRLVAAAATSSEAQRHTLARDAGMPETPPGHEDMLIPTARYQRLWELAEFRSDIPDLALRVAGAYRAGDLGLHDYLFRTAATATAGFATVHRYIEVITTNHRYNRLSPSADSERDQTIEIQLIEGAGRGAELAMEFTLATTLRRFRQSVGQRVTPVRVGFRQRAPRRQDEFVEAFGTDRIDFDVSVDSITLRTADLQLPLRTADSALAAILRRHAALLPKGQLTEPTWPERVQHILTTLIGDGDASLATVARGLAISPRTLQRRLGEADTTWRHELDRARQALADRDRADRPTRATLARRLGYSDERSLRRAARRWPPS